MRTIGNIRFSLLCGAVALPLLLAPSISDAASARVTKIKQKKSTKAQSVKRKAVRRISARKSPETQLRGMFGLTKRVALVTGANRGIGKGVALKLAAAGATVALLGRNKAQLNEVKIEIEKAGGKAIVVTADVTSESQVQAAVAEIHRQVGDISILVNNAGIADSGTTSTITKSTVEKLLVTNVTSTVLVMQAVLPHMKRAGRGSVINMESTTTLQGSGGFPYYGMTKGAVGALTMGWAKEKEFMENNIRVNGIVPGFINTDMSGWVHENGASAKIIQNTPVSRLGLPSDIGKAAVYLASDGSSFVTGSHMVVDGGITMRD